MKLALIVEGDGDRTAVPALVRRVINENEIFHVTVISNPIKAGDIRKLSRDGQIERFVQYACLREADAVLIVLDCDDDCPVEVALEYSRRINDIAVRHDKRIGIAFIKKEFETLFLFCCRQLAASLPKFPWKLEDYDENEDFENVRGAKERFSKFLGKAYKETLDQPRFASAIDIERLRLTSKSFRHLERVTLWLVQPEAEQMTYPPL